MARRISGTRKTKAGARTRPAASRRGAGAKPAARRTTARGRPQRRDPETLRLRALEPTFTVDDIEKSLRFYTEVLGFVVAQRWEEKGALLGVSLKAGACQVGLSQDDWAKGRGRKKGEGMSIRCMTAQDVDALAARIKAAGGRLVQEPTDSPEGGRAFAVEDPDGFRLWISNES